MNSAKEKNNQIKLSKLSIIQEKILNEIAEKINQNGYPPSMREIGDAVNLKSLSSVTHQLHRLEQGGHIKRDANKNRAIEILNPKYKLQKQQKTRIIQISNTPTINQQEVPLVGRISAGVPITAQQEKEDVMSLPTQIVGNGNLFMLKVSGDSMIEAAICDGDYVVIRQQKTAENGEIVAALIDGEATVKTFKKTANEIMLIPQNSNYSIIKTTNAEILGKVVAVLRSVS